GLGQRGEAEYRGRLDVLAGVRVGIAHGAFETHVRTHDDGGGQPDHVVAFGNPVQPVVVVGDGRLDALVGDGGVVRRRRGGVGRCGQGGSGGQGSGGKRPGSERKGDDEVWQHGTLDGQWRRRARGEIAN